MGDVHQPFGGLPPRGASVAAAPAVEPEREDGPLAEPAPKPSKIQKRGTVALIVAAVAAVIVVPIVIVAMTMSGSGDQENSGGPIGSGYVATPEEAAAAEAAIAEGGGAVDGHIVSAELCTALDSFTAVSAGAASSTDVSPETLAAMEVLATVESPNKAAYAGYLGVVKDPASVPSIADAQALSADFTKAVQVDTVTCM